MKGTSEEGTGRGMDGGRDDASGGGFYVMDCQLWHGCIWHGLSA